MNNEKNMNMKLQFYFESQTTIHITCSNGRFYNGKIIDITPKKELLVLKDKKLGNVPILFEEINKLEPYTEDENETRS